MRHVFAMLLLMGCDPRVTPPASDAAVDAMSDIVWGPTTPSTLVTWTCVDPNPQPDCPWGDTVMGHAAVFDRNPPQAALSFRLGYTVSDSIYLPRPCSDVTHVRLVAGEADVWEGDLREEHHTVIAHLMPGDVYTPVVFPENNVLSVQALSAFEFQVFTCQ